MHVGWVLPGIIVKRIKPISAVSAVAPSPACAAIVLDVMAAADASTPRRKAGPPIIPTSAPSAEAGVAQSTNQPIITKSGPTGEPWVPSVPKAPTTTPEAPSAEAGVSSIPTVEVPSSARDERAAAAETEQEVFPPWPDNTAAAPPTNATNRITIVAVGGFPGAGVRTQVTLSAALMRARGFAAVEIYTDSYHLPVPVDRCPVCVELHEKLGRAPHTHCNLCPLSLDVASLIGFIDEIVNSYAGQTDSQQNDKRIVIFVAGRNVLGSPALLGKATVLIWIGLQENIGLCALRRLRADGLWPPDVSEDLTDPVVSALLAFLTEDTTLGLNRLYAHSHRYERVVGRRQTIQYCDVDNNTINEVATVFDRFVLNTFDATPGEPSQAKLAPLVNIPDAPTEAARVVPTADAGVILTPPSVAAAAVAMPSAEAGAGNLVSGKLCE